MFLRFFIIAAILSLATAFAIDTQHILGDTTESKSECDRTDINSLMFKPDRTQMDQKICRGKNSHIELPLACNSPLVFIEHSGSELTALAKAAMTVSGAEKLEEVPWWSPIFNDDDADLIEVLCDGALESNIQKYREWGVEYYQNLDGWNSVQENPHVELWNKQCHHDNMNYWGKVLAGINQKRRDYEYQGKYAYMVNDGVACAKIWIKHACQDDGDSFYAYAQQRREWHFNHIMSELDGIRNDLLAKGSIVKVDALLNVTQILRSNNDKEGLLLEEWNKQRSDFCPPACVHEEL